MDENLNDFLKDLLEKSGRSAHLPHEPLPPEMQEGTSGQNRELFYKEIDSNEEIIAGTSLTFGTQEIKIVDNNGNANRVRKTIGHILGSGPLVTSLNPTAKDGINLPGVGGACSFCRAECLELLEANQIPLEEAERRSLFDTGSAAQCDLCGRRDLCIRHCRPFEVKKDDQVQILKLCPECTKAAQRDKWVSTAIDFLSSPIVEQKQLPDVNNKESFDG